MMWITIQILLIIILLLAIILLAKYTYAQLGRPKIHLAYKWKKCLFHSLIAIVCAAMLFVIVWAGIGFWEATQREYKIEYREDGFRVPEEGGFRSPSGKVKWEDVLEEDIK